MSKIYEALLRAEQDRADQERAKHEQTGQTPAPGAPTEPQQIIAAASPDPEPAPRPFPHPLPPAIESFAAATPVATEAAVYDPAPLQPPPAPYETPEHPPTRAIYSAIPAPIQTPVAAAPLAAEIPPPPAAATPPRIPSDDRDFAPAKIRRFPWAPTFDTLPALEDRGAPVEQFRSLRSRMFEFRDLNKLKSIMVSSGLPQEGKSFIAANLAISFARHRAARVLLIDGDMRRSTLHKLLGTPGDVGLAEYLSGAAGLLDIMQQVEPAAEDSAARLGLASLTFIPGGSDIEKAADLSGNPRFAHLMKTLAPFFDWIVVDSAPVNVVADGVNLARACDGVLLVARGGVTKYESAQRALVELKASTILGYVLNAVETTSLTGGYYGYESYDSPQKY